MCQDHCISATAFRWWQGTCGEYRWLASIKGHMRGPMSVLRQALLRNKGFWREAHMVLQELAAVAKQRRAAESLLTIDLKEETLSTVISRAIAMLPLHSSVCRSVRQATLVSWPFYASLSVYPVDLEVGQASEADLTGYNRWCRKKAENFAQACSFFKSRRKVSRGE